LAAPITAAPFIGEAAMAANKHQVSIPQPPHHREVIILLLYYDSFSLILLVYSRFNCWLKSIILPPLTRLEMWGSVQIDQFPQFASFLLIGIVSLNGLSYFIFYGFWSISVENYFLHNFFCFLLNWFSHFIEVLILILLLSCDDSFPLILLFSCSWDFDCWFKICKLASIPSLITQEMWVSVHCPISLIWSFYVN